MMQFVSKFIFEVIVKIIAFTTALFLFKGTLMLIRKPPDMFMFI